MKRAILLAALCAGVSVASADTGAAAEDQAANLAQVQAGYAANQALINATCGPAPDGLSCGPNNPCTVAKLQESRVWVKCAMTVLMPKPIDLVK